MIKQDKALELITNSLNQLHRENQSYRDSLSEKIEKLSKQVEEKHLPITLEQDILKTCQSSIAASIKSVLEGYSSPLNKLIVSVIDSHSIELKEIVDSSFKKVIRTEEFKASIVSAFSHKIARSIISNNDGLFDKVNNELKQDPVFKSKITLAISNIVEECLKQQNTQEV